MLLEASLSATSDDSVPLEVLRQRGPLPEYEALDWARALTTQVALLHKSGRIDGGLHGYRILCLSDASGFRACEILPEGEEDLDNDPAVAACLAPEQLAGGQADAASDIYAIGVMLYSLLTGRLPFAHPDVGSQGRIARGSGVWRLVRAQPTLPSRRVPGIDRRWDSVLLRAFELDPLDRFASADDLAAALHGRPVTPGRRQMLLRREKQLRRRKRAALICGSLLMFFLIAGLAWQTRPTSVPQEAGLLSQRSAEAEERRALAILGFENLSEDSASWISTALSEMLAADLAATDSLRLISGRHVARMKLELGDIDHVNDLSGERLQRIRDHLDADLLIDGSYRTESSGASDADPTIYLELRLLDARDPSRAAVKLSENHRTTQLVTLVEHLGDHLRRDLKLDDVSIDHPESRLVVLPQGEAARLYAEGLDRLRLFDAREAKDLLRRAAEQQPNSPQIHIALAEALSELGNDAEAAEAARRAHESALDLPREERLFIEGRYREISLHWLRATEIFRMLWEFYPDEIEYGLHLAAAQTAAGDREALETIGRLLEKAPDNPRVALAEAEAAEIDSDYARKREAALRAAETGERLGARLLIAEAKVLQSFAAWNLGRIEEAKSAVEEAHRLYSEAGDPHGTAYALNRKAIWFYEDGSLDASIEAFEEALAISRTLGNDDQIGRALNNMSLPKIERGDLEQAQAHLEEAVRMDRNRGRRLYEAIALQNLAETHSLLGRHQDARSTYDQAFALLDELDYRRIQAYALAGRGEALRIAGDPEAARAPLEEGLAVAQELEHHSYIARAHFRLGDLEFDLDHLDAARRHHEEALRLRMDLGEGGRVARSRSALARIDLRQNRVESARNHLEAALPVFRRQNRRDDEILALSLFLQIDPAPEVQERLGELLPGCQNPAVRNTAREALIKLSEVSP